jgi:hypothetical protein
VFIPDSETSDQTIRILFHDNFVNFVCVMPAGSSQSNESNKSADQSDRHRYFFTIFLNSNPRIICRFSANQRATVNWARSLMPSSKRKA